MSVDVMVVGQFVAVIQTEKDEGIQNKRIEPVPVMYFKIKVSCKV